LQPDIHALADPLILDCRDNHSSSQGDDGVVVSGGRRLQVTGHVRFISRPGEWAVDVEVCFGNRIVDPDAWAAERERVLGDVRYGPRRVDKYHARRNPAHG
jgi:hypothetical protein